MKFSLLVAARTLAFRDKISCRWVKGFPLNEVVRGVPVKKTLICRYWLVLCKNGCR